MDYKQLLIKYMSHVCEREGITFVDHISLYSKRQVKFTPEEKAELEKLEEELIET